MNLPNKLTALRILLVPAIAAFLLLDAPALRLPAFLLFLAAFLTDVADGYLARSRNEVTDLGKFMDPLADKMLGCSVLVCLVAQGLAPAAALIVILVREFAVSGLRLTAAAQGRVIAANRWGKMKTTVLNLSLSLILLLRCFDLPWLPVLSRALVWVSAAVTAVSGALYLARNADVFRAGGGGKKC